MTSTHRKFLKSLTISDLLKQRDVITVDPDTTVEEALSILAKEKILSLPIVDKKKGDGKILGILNITDLATAIALQDTFKQFKDMPAKLEEIGEDRFDELLNKKNFVGKSCRCCGTLSRIKDCLGV